MRKMETEKITVRLPIHQIQAIDTFISLGEFASRSEAIRRAIAMLLDDLTEKMYEKMDAMRRLQELQAMAHELEKLRKK